MLVITPGADEALTHIRTNIDGLPEDAVVLSATELADLQDRLFQLRCAAEDVRTAAEDGAAAGELRQL